MVNSAAGPEGGFDKVVIHLGNEVIRGFLESHEGNSLNTLLENATAAPPSLLRLRRLDNDAIQEIPIQVTKAIFYVKSFDGDSQHKSLRFYRGAPIVHGVWIRLDFVDGEVMEGLVHNTLRLIVDPGFFMRPTDPYSNNQLVYVVKSWIKEFRILGLRKI